MRHSILVIDDELNAREGLTSLLEEGATMWRLLRTDLMAFN
ncbi:MAG: hypothetical protein O3B01_14530 [Planctomycetota bacterium]|nr:hypothetical protein [Planctomycetota bacterium]